MIFITLIRRNILLVSRNVEIFESAIMDRATRDLKHDFNGENSIALLTVSSAYHAHCNITRSALLLHNKTYIWRIQ